MKLPTYYEVYCIAYCDEEDKEICGRYLKKSSALRKFREVREEVKKGWRIDKDWEITANRTDYYAANIGCYKYWVEVCLSKVEIEVEED